MATAQDAALAAIFGNATDRTTGNADTNAFEKTIAANDIYRQIAAPISSARYDTSTWSPGATIGVSAGQAFLSAALNEVARQNEAAQLSQVNQLLPALYKDPGSVVFPSGVDAQGGEGLRASIAQRQLEQRQSTDEAIRRTAGEKGITIDANGTWSVTPGATSAIAQVLGAKQVGKKPPALAQRTIKDLAGTTAAIEALNANDERIKTLGSGDGFLGGIENWGLKHVPGSAAYQYEKGLPFLADPLTVGLSGSSRQGILQKTLDSLSLGFAQSPASMLDISNQARQAMVDKAQSSIDLLKESGTISPDALQNYQDKLDAAKAGTAKDYSVFGAAEAPKASSSSLSDNEKVQAIKEAAILKAQGLAPTEIAAALRAKYKKGG